MGVGVWVRVIKSTRISWSRHEEWIFERRNRWHFDKDMSKKWPLYRSRNRS